VNEIHNNKKWQLGKFPSQQVAISGLTKNHTVYGYILLIALIALIMLLDFRFFKFDVAKFFEKFNEIFELKNKLRTLKLL
jgi:hypothetical protein